MLSVGICLEPAPEQSFSVEELVAKETSLAQIIPYLLPQTHPLHEQLEKIFTSSRVILNLKTLKKAGFTKCKPRKFTRLLVTTHPNTPGYIYKLYLDAQKYYKKLPEYEYWLMRVKGANLILKEIRELGLEEYFKVPKKWIYQLPHSPSPPSEFLRKDFILVEEDMGLYNEKENAKMWKSDKVSREILDGLYTILKNIGLHDCVKIDNIPFSKDGKIAFVDTQTYHEWPVQYKNLIQSLSPDNQEYWKSLIKNPTK